MTANPLTDQILANLTDIRRQAERIAPIPAEGHDDIALFAKRLTDSLPGVDRALIGQVLAHSADVYGMFATCGNRRPLTTEALIAVVTLGEAGRRLYLGGTRDEQTQGGGVRNTPRFFRVLAAAGKALAVLDRSLAALDQRIAHRKTRHTTNQNRS